MAILEALGAPPNGGYFGPKTGDFGPKIGNFQPFFSGGIFNDPALNSRQKCGDLGAKLAEIAKFGDLKVAASK